MTSKKKILVIGGGFSGIGSIKSLKEEGFDPICYEKTSDLGGTWHYREETPFGVPSIMPTTVINHSKEMGTLSDFIPNKSLPNYLRHHELLDLFKEIANKFDCVKHIQYNREVIKVKRSADYDETGRWDVKVRNTENGEISDEVFDGVMVSVGQFTYPKMAEFPGMEKFKGPIIHTHSLKGVHKFLNKKVLVIGIGCSGLDAAAEISNVASQVYLSSRNGTWLLPRIGPFGLPFDYVILRRYGTLMQKFFGWKFASWYLETFQLNKKFNHNLYNLCPEYPALAKDPAINDLLPAKLVSGSVKLRKNVKCFTEKGVIFENETHVTEVDAVIMATGYKWQFPFLEDGIVVNEDGRINLYKCMYPPHLKHPTLVVIGFILPFGPGFPCGEMQCRWATQIFSGNCKLPSEDEMMADIIKRHEENVKRYAPSDKVTVKVDFIQYLDEIASQFGAKPNLWKILFTDPKLWRAIVFGPSLPYQYRLQGPHKWHGARDAILTSYSRVRYPLSGEPKKKSTKPKFTFGFYFKYIVTFLLMAFWLTQSETSVKYYLLALILPYFMTWKGFYKKYFFSLLMLPFFVTWNGFVSSYFITIFAPIFLAIITSI